MLVFFEAIFRFVRALWISEETNFNPASHPKLVFKPVQNWHLVYITEDYRDFSAYILWPIWKHAEMVLGKWKSLCKMTNHSRRCLQSSKRCHRLLDCKRLRKWKFVRRSRGWEDVEPFFLYQVLYIWLQYTRLIDWFCTRSCIQFRHSQAWFQSDRNDYERQ